jgi:hypothetical protein
VTRQRDISPSGLIMSQLVSARPVIFWKEIAQEFCFVSKKLEKNFFLSFFLQEFAE